MSPQRKIGHGNDIHRNYHVTERVYTIIQLLVGLLCGAVKYHIVPYHSISEAPTSYFYRHFGTRMRPYRNNIHVHNHMAVWLL